MTSLAYTGNVETIVKNQSVYDIIRNIALYHRRYSSDYDKIALQFWKGNAVDTARSLFDYCKRNFKYVIEPDSRQTLRSPGAILKTGPTGIDCKNYSLFIGGVLDSLRRSGKKIDWFYRYGSYKVSDKTPHHVFVVLRRGNDEIFIDPVFDYFNDKRKLPFYKLDKHMLVGISGAVGARKKRGQKIKAALKKVKRGVLKFAPASAAARNSFLLIVKLNLFNIATRLQALAGRSDSLKRFWSGIGGNYNSLLNNIRQGAARREKKINRRMGAAPVGIAAAVASATPILLKVIQLLKEAGIKAEDLGNFGKRAVNKIIDNKDAAAESEANTDSATDSMSFTDSESTTDAETVMDDEFPTDNETPTTDL